MTEFGDQNDPNHEAGAAVRDSFGWFAGAVVLAHHARRSHQC
jgi:hypothetical protein